MVGPGFMPSTTEEGRVTAKSLVHLLEISLSTAIIIPQCSLHIPLYYGYCLDLI